jgi:hypothetical protein
VRFVSSALRNGGAVPPGALCKQIKIRLVTEAKKESRIRVGRQQTQRSVGFSHENPETGCQLGSAPWLLLLSKYNYGAYGVDFLFTENVLD